MYFLTNSFGWKWRATSRWAPRQANRGMSSIVTAGISQRCPLDGALAEDRRRQELPQRLHRVERARRRGRADRHGRRCHRQLIPLGPERLRERRALPQRDVRRAAAAATTTGRSNPVAGPSIDASCRPRARSAASATIGVVARSANAPCRAVSFVGSGTTEMAVGACSARSMAAPGTITNVRASTAAWRRERRMATDGSTASSTDRSSRDVRSRGFHR